MAASVARRLAVVGAAALAAFALLVGLGCWQLQRLAWKTELVARIERRMAEPPRPAPGEAEWPTLDIDALAYAPVRVEGVFDHAREARVYVALGEPRGAIGGPGYFILTPLMQDDGSAILVNRGFAPEGRQDPATRPDGQTPGRVTVSGLLRGPEDRNAFTPADEPAKRLFFARDPGPIAAGLGLVRAAPFTIDADATPNPGGLPQGGETRISFPNRHLEYALTWFGLAAALLGVFGVYAFGLLRDARRRA